MILQFYEDNFSDFKGNIASQEAFECFKEIFIIINQKKKNIRKLKFSKGRGKRSGFSISIKKR